MQGMFKSGSYLSKNRETRGRQRKKEKQRNRDVIGPSEMDSYSKLCAFLFLFFLISIFSESKAYKLRHRPSIVKETN